MRPRVFFVLAAILAAAAALRLAGIGAQPLWLDESWSRWVSGHDWRGLRDAVAAYETHPPFYYSLLKLWRSLVGSSAFDLRLLSVLAGMAMIPAAWLCARQIGRLRAAFWASGLAMALAAFSPALVAASRQARPYALFALAFAVALGAALFIVRSVPRSGRQRFWAWTAYAGGLEAVLWLHSLGALFAATLAAALFLGLAIEHRLRRELPAFLAAHLAAALAYLPAFLLILEQRRAWTSTWLRFSWRDVSGGLAEGLAFPGAGALLIFLFAGLGAAAMLRSREDRPAALVLAATALLPAAATILVSAFSSPIFLARTLVPSALPLLLLAAAGIAAIENGRFRAAAGAALLILIGAASVALAARPPEEKWDRLSAWLDRHIGAREEVWLLPNELAMPLAYASARPVRYRILGVPADFPAPRHRGPRYSGTLAVPGVTEADAKEFADGARRRNVAGIWLVSRFPALFDPAGALPRALGPSHLAARDLEFQPLIVEYYKLDRPRPRD